MTGAVVLVATPIGNLGDLSPRSIEALGEADVIACEDTRRTRKLLSHAGLPTPKMVTVNDHTESRAVPRLIAKVAEGARVALVSDAGTPGISDPGERLVRAAIDAGLSVEVVPGPSAAVCALVVSGLPTARFVFEGFLPRTGAGRSDRLGALADERRTIVLYEAPHRLVRTLGDLATVLGSDRRVVVARELTKLHEQVWRGVLGEAAAAFGSDVVRGEIAVVVEGAPKAPEPDDAEIEMALAAMLTEGVSRRDAASRVADALDVSRRRVYELANRLGGAPS